MGSSCLGVWYCVVLICMAADYRVSVDLSGILPLITDAVQSMLPQLSQAIALTAEHGANEWKGSVMKARLWAGEKQPYIESIKWKMTGDFSAEIWSDYPLADEIEKGRPARDLKKMLQTSKKTRTSARGNKYLIIPFRHNTPGQDAHAPAMPSNIYDVAKQLTPSKVLTPGSKKPATRLSASGHTVVQHSYQWNGRLPAGLAPKLKPHHKTDIYAGMVRMDTSSGKQKSSAYLTFRVMSERSSGWIIQARPGLEIASKVADDLQPVLETAIGKVISINTRDLF